MHFSDRKHVSRNNALVEVATSIFLHGHNLSLATTSLVVSSLTMKVSFVLLGRIFLCLIGGCEAFAFRSRATESSTQLKGWSDALSIIDTFYQTSPYAAGALTCGVKASAADFVAQRRQMRNKEAGQSKFQMARNFAFLVYGAIYQGLAQEFIYNHCYATWFGYSSHPLVVLQKVCFDLFVQTTLLTLPMAYLTKAAIFRYPFREGLRRYKDDVLNNGLLTKYFSLWGPVQCLTFGVVPEHLRISFIAAVSFFWLIILSTISGRADAAAPRSKEALDEIVSEGVFSEEKEDVFVLFQGESVLE